MKRFIPHLYILLTALLLSSCASKRLANKAMEFEQAGLYTDAAEYFFQSAAKNPKNVDAKVGLRKNGQIVLDEKMEKFNGHYQSGAYQKAVNDYLDAKAYINKLKGVGIEPIVDERHEEYYNEAKDFYLEDEYAKAVEALQREEFSNAELLFKNIIRVQSNYKETKTNYNKARYEPVYRLGVEQMKQQKYRTAYYTFSRILSGVNNYQQAQNYQQVAKENATITVLVAPIVARNRTMAQAAVQLRQQLYSELQNSKNPFIKVVDYKALPSGVIKKDLVSVDMSTAQIAGIKTVLSVNLIDFRGASGSVKRTTQKAYIKEVQKYTDENGDEKSKTLYHKTQYYQYEKQNTAWLKMNYQFTRTENGEIIGADVIDINTTDKARYATFKGNYKSLVPGTWQSLSKKSSLDKVSSSSTQRSQLQSLFKASKEPATVAQLQNQLMGSALKNVGSLAQNYKPEQ